LSSSRRCPPNKRRIPEASGGCVAQGPRSGYEERQFSGNEDQMSVADKTQVKKSGGLGETLSVIFQALLLALVIRSFIFQPFSIPSGSMRPTLLEGDYLFVSKFAYGYSHHSLPFSPNLFAGRIWSAEPIRGDVAVFKFPPNPKLDYIKRVIGLPGDKIQMINGVLNINGVPVKREKNGVIDDVDVTEEMGPVDVYRETLPNGVSYDTLDINPNSSTDNTREFVVPEGHYFMMGDNRDNSSDSRLSVGFVPAENLVGRAKRIFFSIDGGSSPLEIWKWPSGVRTERLLQAVQ
jgi:signal peptidase I